MILVSNLLTDIALKSQMWGDWSLALVLLLLSIFFPTADAQNALQAKLSQCRLVIVRLAPFALCKSLLTSERALKSSRPFRLRSSGPCGAFNSDGTPTCSGVSGICTPSPTPAPPKPTTAAPNPTPSPPNPTPASPSPTTAAPNPTPTPPTPTPAPPNPTPAPTNPGPNPNPAPTNPGPNPTPPCSASRAKLAVGSACSGGAVNPCYDAIGASLICWYDSKSRFRA